MIAWTFADQYPQVAKTLTILNAPHMKLYLREVLWVRQLVKSWYVMLFQLPAFPEWVISLKNFAAVRFMLRYFPKSGTFTVTDIQGYIDQFNRRGALTAAINYYRANFRPAALSMVLEARSKAPTLVIWGERDPALSIRLLDRVEAVASNVIVKRIAQASHWVQNEAPEEVNDALVGFLMENR